MKKKELEKSLRAEITRRKLLRALAEQKRSQLEKRRPVAILRPIRDKIPNVFFK